MWIDLIKVHRTPCRGFSCKIFIGKDFCTIMRGKLWVAGILYRARMIQNRNGWAITTHEIMGIERLLWEMLKCQPWLQWRKCFNDKTDWIFYYYIQDSILHHSVTFFPFFLIECFMSCKDKGSFNWRTIKFWPHKTVRVYSHLNRYRMEAEEIL